MLYLLIIKVITLCSLAFLGLVVLLQDKKLWANRIFALLTAAIFFWVFTLLMSDVSKSESQAMFWTKLALVGPAFIPSLFLHFSYLFPERKEASKLFIFLIYLPSVWLCLNTPFRLNVESITFDHGFVNMDAGPIYGILLGYFIIFITWSIVNLITSYKKSRGRQKLQLFYIILGVSLAIPYGIFTNNILVLFGNSKLTSYGFLSALIFFIFVFYAIVRHRLMGIRFLVHKIYIYAVITIFTYVCFRLAFSIGDYFGGIHSTASIVLGILFSIIYAVLIVRLIRFLNVTGDYLFFKGKNPMTVSKDFIINIKKAIYIRELFELIENDLAKIMGIGGIGLWIVEGEVCEHKLSEDKNKRFGKYDISACPIILDNLQKRKIIVRDEVVYDKGLLQELDRKKIKIVAPLIGPNNNIKGVLLIGEKNSHSAFNQEEINFFELVCPQIAAALLKVCKVEILKKQNDELIKLVKDFNEAASQQIQTPITVINNMLKKANGPDMTDAEKIKVIDSISGRIDKLNEIVNDFVITSELETQPMHFEEAYTDLEELLREIVKEKQETAKEQGVDLILKTEKNIPKILSNRPYLKQALANIINNAIQYNKQGGSVAVDLKLEKHKQSVFSRLKNGRKVHEVIIRIIDTGIGIQENKKKAIFEKYTRADNASFYHMHGSGLGLYNAKKIIESHEGGEAYVESSELDEGTVVVVKFLA